MHSTRSLLLFLAMLILAALPGSLPASAAASQATFLGTDTSTQGNWKGLYGTDGYVIANDSQKLPSYATFAVENQTDYTWASGTTDVRALQSGVNSGRIASTWYSNTSFNFDLNLTDGNAHKVALYAVDWDNFEGGRIESVQIADASTGTVLDTEKISAFNNGIYLTYNLSGHVTITVSFAGGGNPVISGLFFTGASMAKFAGTDTTTQGNWKGLYGTDGYVIANDSQKIPSYATFAVENQTNYTWASGTTDVRALESGANSGRIASTWFTNNTAFNFDLNLTDGNSHQVGLYAVDWDNFGGGRIESVQISDANSGAVLDTEKISKFNNGIYLIWSISGHVTITVAYAGGGNPVISGIFFAATSTAKFIDTDASTEGNWKSVYGSDGYAIANDSQKIPSYATFAVQNQTNYTWASSTTDVRALQSGANAGRIASTWYSNSSFNFDLNLTDGNSHQIALYALDWDNFQGGRIETVQIISCSNVFPYFENEANSVDAARLANDLYADLVRKYPKKFAAFCCTPLPHLDASLKEMARGLDELHMVGVTVATFVLGKSIADPMFEPLFAEANRRKAVVFIHPPAGGGGSQWLDPPSSSGPSERRSKIPDPDAVRAAGLPAKISGHEGDHSAPRRLRAFPDDPL